MMLTRIENLKSPIFYGREANFDIFYTSGLILFADHAVSEGFISSLQSDSPSPRFSIEREALFLAATNGDAQYQQRIHQQFLPECLTLYPNQKCNLFCEYCFSDNGEIETSTLSIRAIQAGLEVVGKNCAHKNLPLTVVFHGGGEPTLSWRLIDQVQPLIKQSANTNGIPFFRYLATNGMISANKIDWIKNSFELVGLSCDGPPEIQDVQRPTKNQRIKGSDILVKTGQELIKAQVPLQIRVTITNATAGRQADICKFIINTFGPIPIHVEPVYFGGRATELAAITADNTNIFIESYQEAAAIAQNCGTIWQLSGSRINEIHASHCNIFRNVLQLVPGDVATACFKLTDEVKSTQAGMTIGHFRQQTQSIFLDPATISTLQQNYCIPVRCNNCFIKNQCTLGCPNQCLLDGEGENEQYCEIHQSIAYGEILHRIKKESKVKNTGLIFL